MIAAKANDLIKLTPYFGLLLPVGGAAGRRGFRRPCLPSTPLEASLERRGC